MRHSRRRNRSLPTTILLILLAAIIATSGYYFLTKNNGNTGNNTPNNPSNSIAAANLAAVQSAIQSDDWTTYMHDPRRTGFNAGETKLSPANAADLKLLWKHKIGNVIAAQPIIKGDTLYIGAWDGYMYALSTADGSEKWKANLGTTSARSCVPEKAGITSAPVITNGALYVGGGDEYLYALNTATGAVLWKFKTGDNSEAGGSYNWASPLLYNGRVYMSNSAFCDRPFPYTALYGVDAQSGQQAQKMPFIPDDQRGGGIWTSPTVDEATGEIYVTTGSGDFYIQHSYSIARLNPADLTVEDAWQIPISQQVFDGDWSTTPTLWTAKNGTLMVGAAAKNGWYYAFDAHNITKGPAWSVQLADGGQCPQCGQGTISSSVYAYNTVYAAGGYISLGEAQKFAGSVVALDPDTGKTRWLHPTQGSVLPALAAANGLIADAADDTLEVLDASSGKVLWDYATGAQMYAAPAIANGVLYAASNDGYLYAFSAGPYPDNTAAYKVASVGSNPPGFTPFRTPVPAPKLQGSEQCFADTNHCARGAFLDFWKVNGGLERFGPAETDELSEAGRTVQYFRNAVLEIGPDPDEKGAQIRIGKLDFNLFYYEPKSVAFDGASAIAGSTFFTQTSHNVSEPFLSYWHTHGEVVGLGYPVSEAFDEYSVLDDIVRHVQYFERARLEIVKGANGSDTVQLGALGLQIYKQRYGTLPP